ncbi:PREDICTED: uncharacterized protein LOC107072136 [Polistes dominula]|uniref:Uncharacterized protein LOC107072136 n=1 Tax=Polistes dominula TaxID=743375 RepID=A0ABM1J4C5_POLDO|nr:PREDICTED: uncharacterized protein LOC107072136 [Polistes dominula]XP_015187307.1 PREDICTED: uncharacterized protein LOC107072136 [Polistes dominula]XP_015187308.1 PREDICTED: uncharacterized protein LOC107072136 [Polistes dominula]XP_015187309.1 PREDICTED: uncharacterized protein LOC107072136 [Polistes dominula]XP_015187310.1 PREDICTED: uncharacterized protein LOC107072136 [Polistes dominula]XP_015187313.1 PREDICTED: uncharacterized protein LOC107072136 [Polistes dominula]
MPLYSRSDNWASKLVIVLQFTAWISVGIVLLQKGVTSLRSQSMIETNSNTQETNDTTMKYLNEKTKRTTDQEDLSSYISKSKEHSIKKLLKSYPEKANDNIILEKHSSRHLNINGKYYEDSGDKISDMNWLTKESKENKQEEEKDIMNLNKIVTRTSINDSSIYSNETQEYKITTVDSEKRNNSNVTSLRNGKKLRARMSSGAAAAIAMVAVGAAMLVVGPMVIALRALDKRRQERRYLKSLGWNDQPPTYEQATLMSEVPRYSTLNLNTTVHSSCVASPSACLPANTS